MRIDSVTAEHTYPQAIAKVWAAITDPEQMQEWYFDIPGFRAEVGFEFRFLAGDDTQKWLHVCKVTDVVHGTLIAYSWRYDGYEGDSTVTFRLHEAHSGTHLTITHTGLASFPDLPEFQSESFRVGWSHFAEKALPGFLGR